MELTHEETTELINLFHLAKVMYQDRYNRLILAAKWFHQEHPDVSTTRAYKTADYATRLIKEI